jgi:hypothetical protein
MPLVFHEPIKTKDIMIFQGRINKLLPLQTGTSAKGEWSRQDFIFEYYERPEDRFSDKVVLSVMGEKIGQYNLHEGDEVKIGFGHFVREYQGRYFNEVRIYHYEKVANASQAMPQQPQPQQDQQLPF